MNMGILLCLLLVCVGLHNVVVGSKIEDIKPFLLRPDSIGKLSEGSLTVLTAMRLNESLEEYSKALCEKVGAAMEKNKGAEMVYYATTLNVALHCDLDTPLNEKLILKALKKTSDLENLYFVSRILLLNAKKLQLSQEMTVAIKNAFNAVHKIETSSIEELGYQFEIASSLSKVLGGAKDRSVLEKMFSLAKKAVAASSSVSAQNIPSLKAASIFVRGLTKLVATSKKVKGINPNVFEHIANYISKHKIQSLQDGYDYVETVQALTTNKIFNPLNVGDIKLKDGIISVEVTSLYGESVSTLIKISKAYKQGQSSIRLIDEEDMKQDGTTFTFDTNSRPEYQEHFIQKDCVGVIVFELDLGTEVLVKRNLSFDTEIEISSLLLHVKSDKSKSSKIIRRQPVEYPSQISTLTLTYPEILEFQTTILIKGSGKPINPRQVFLHVFNERQDEVLSFNPSKFTDGEFKIDLDFSTHGLNRISGTYKVELVIGDIYIKNPTIWYIGDIIVEFDDAEFKADDEANLYVEQPLINHEFREQEKRAHSTISTAFTAIILVPLVIFIVFAIGIGKPLVGCPSGLQFISTVLFQVCILLMLGVIFMYFWEWQIFTVLKYLLVLGLLSSLFGVHALKGVHMKNLK